MGGCIVQRNCDGQRRGPKPDADQIKVLVARSVIEGGRQGRDSVRILLRVSMPVWKVCLASGSNVRIIEEWRHR